MRKKFIHLILVLMLLCSVDGTVNAQHNNPPPPGQTTIAACSPDSVLQQFFVLLQSGQPNEAQELFLIRNPDQESAVRKYINGGVVFFANHQISNRVVGTFRDGRLAVCAIEQTSMDLPEEFELENACLTAEDGRWRLLPQPQDYRSRLNGLSPQEQATFGQLQKEFFSFKRGYRVDQAID